MSKTYDTINYDDDDEEDVPLTDETETSYTSKDTILFVIDCQPAMYQPDEDGKIPVRVAFDCVASVLLNKVFSSASDQVGVLLYGTTKKKNVANHDNIYVLQDIDVPDTQKIKQAQSFGSNGTSDPREEFGSTNDEFPFGNVFWTCTDLFATISAKGTRRIFLITNEDNPHAKNQGLRNTALQRAKDLWETGIRIELFGLNVGDHLFDNQHFYQQIISLEDNLENRYDDDRYLDAKSRKGESNDLDELLVQVRRKEQKKRSAFRITMRIADDIEIGIRGYNLITEQKKGQYKYVTTSGQQVEEVKVEVITKDAESGEMLLPTDIHRAWTFGGEQVVFTTEEIKKLQTVGEPGLTLLGVRDRSSLKPYYNLDHAYFIYPDESNFEGSTRTFSALLTAMLQKDRIGYGAFIRRTNALPQIVAIYPQPEVVDHNGAQERPPGFHLIPIPYADDYRKIPILSTPKATPEQVNIFENMIRSITIKSGYKPAAYENPSLQLHYATLQSLALDQTEEPPPVEDKTMPRNKQIKDRLGHTIQALKEILPSPEEEAVTQSGYKRTSDSGDGGHSKRSRQDKSVEECYRDGTLNRCTVGQMKTWLQGHGVTAKGPKADVIEQVSRVMERKLR
ncbi:hypothetical protein VTP01DRAFT_8162 [Rhizomucor pusillus]|uniref:uncharacterized protein n=1 Tax=Rhizomucor pusillus TaxID=4840 RepID=UPI00374280D2